MKARDEVTGGAADLAPGELQAVDEAARSGLALGALPGNPAKIRLLLDLAGHLHAAGRLRVLDVGAGGQFTPFNLWEPFLPLADRIELVGVDVAHLDATAARAAELGFPLETRRVGADGLVEAFGRDAFDAVVSTQVLEHLPRWRDALTQARDVLRVGGVMYVTCDSGDAQREVGVRGRLWVKNAYARACAKSSWVRNTMGSRWSGDWERGPTAAHVLDHADRIGLEVLALRHYGIRDLKTMQTRADANGRLLWLAYEEALADGDPKLFRLLYLRASRAKIAGQPASASR